MDSMVLRGLAVRVIASLCVICLGTVPAVAGGGGEWRGTINNEWGIDGNWSSSTPGSRCLRLASVRHS